MNTIVIQNQLLATKFFVPVASHPLIPRSQANTLLNESLRYPLTLISAPAGFGKTMLLSSWVQSLPMGNPLVAWVSLDEEDNDPRLFWTYALSALEVHQPGRFTSLLKQLQLEQEPPLKFMMNGLINLLLEGDEHFVLILDDFHVIKQRQIQESLIYLIEHLTPKMHILLATRSDPPLPLPQLRARRQVLEVRTDLLRCTTEETRNFFETVIGIQLSEETVQQVTASTDGWLAALQLLGLSLAGHADPVMLLREARGDQHSILDYLAEEVLRQQPPEIQSFLYSTCILDRLNASLCNAVTGQTGSQRMLEQLERSNLFIMSLDSTREWYRYHSLFAQALRYQLGQTQEELIPTFHARASHWYAEHNQMTPAILHGFNARQWPWVADLIEQKLPSLMSHAWGINTHQLSLLRGWLEQLPSDVVHSRPRLCLACALLIWMVAPQHVVKGWLDAAETTLKNTLTRPSDDPSVALSEDAQHDQENLLGEVMAWRAFLHCHVGNGKEALSLCQQALVWLRADNAIARAIVNWAQFRAAYVSSANDAVAAIQSGLEAGPIAQSAGQASLALVIMSTTACYMIGAGQLYKAKQLTQQAMILGAKPGETMTPETGWPAVIQAHILREWNQLDIALSLVTEAIELCRQAESMSSLVHLLYGYAILISVQLSRGDYEAAFSTFQKFDQLGTRMNHYLYMHVRSHFTVVDQVRLWLARGDMDQAISWMEGLNMEGRNGTPFEHEREEVGQARILLATDEALLALEHLERALARATAGQRWGHVLEIQLLQAIAYQKCHQRTQAQATLLEAVRLAEPEGYIRRFIDEGPQMERLLTDLREQLSETKLISYVDKLLVVFPGGRSKAQEAQLKQVKAQKNVLPLLEPLSDREQEVLSLLAQGASNQEIARTLTIVVDTTKRHITHIFTKLGVQNRVQAVKRAQDLGLI